MNPLEGVRPVDDLPGAFADEVERAFAGRPGPRFVLVLSGGDTARTCYERLAERERIDWSVVDIYMGDERWVPADHADANQRLVREALLDRVGPVGAFRPMPTDGTPAGAASAYGALVAEVVATIGIDLVHLGMGPDGHTASLFPGSPTLASDDLVAATADPSGRNPHTRLTLTFAAIDQARLALFTVAGASKRPAIDRLRRGEDLPAARVRARAVRWLVDDEAFEEAG